MKLAAAIIAAVLAAACGPALADPPAHLVPDDGPLRLQLAHQLYDLSGGTASAEQHVRQLFEATSKLVAANTPPEEGRLVTAIQHDMQEELIAMAPQLVDVGVHAYADQLSAQELRDYIAWLSSDSGRAITRKGPAVRAEIFQLETPLMTALIPDLKQKVSTRVCEELHCTPQQRQIVAQAMAHAFPQHS
jgi:hypothetical protein